MKPIYNWHGLEQFGIGYLTGERCAYSQRLLCDINEDGADLLADYLGVTAFRAPWNSAINGKPAVSSVMLHRDGLQQIAVFACFRAGALGVFVALDGSVVPITEQDRLAQYEKAIELGRVEGRLLRNPAVNSAQPREGSINVHAMSGTV